MIEQCSSIIGFSHLHLLRSVHIDRYISGASSVIRSIVEQLEARHPMFPSIVGSTSLYLLPGDPVTNVRLPRMFNAVFERFGIDAVMAPVQVGRRDLAVFVKAAFLARNVHGMVIAPPHKPSLVDLLDGCGLFGRVAGSANV